jgi:toxin YoeB
VNVNWASSAWDDYIDYQQRDSAIADKINRLIADIARSPFKGLGKPEPLRGPMSGWWSRRITEEHRFVYRVAGARGPDQRLDILQCRFHYADR